MMPLTLLLSSQLFIPYVVSHVSLSVPDRGNAKAHGKRSARKTEVLERKATLYWSVSKSSDVNSKFCLYTLCIFSINYADEYG